MSTHETDRPRPWFARHYAGMTDDLDARGLGPLRRELVADLGGDVVEVGCGNGQNFGYYPAAVRCVRAVEPEPHLRRLATDAAGRSVTNVHVEPGRGEALPLPDASVDAGVLCLVLCSIRRPELVTAEIARVVRPGGTLVFLEHCTADTWGLRLVQRAVDATLWPLLTGGCHTASHPVRAITSAGFVVDRVRSLRYPERPTVPASPHVLGRATRP